MSILTLFANLFKSKNTNSLDTAKKEKVVEIIPPQPAKSLEEVKPIIPAIPKIVIPKKELWIPFAKKWPKPMTTRGNYRKGYPEGAVIHYTAGRYGTNAIESGISSGYSYLLIDKGGEIYQTVPLNRWGYHAGASSWKGLGTGVSEYLAGIEITSAGIVTKVEDNYQTWFKTLLTKDEVRFVKNKDNQKEGYYHKYTKEQEDSLIKLLLWLKENNPDVFNFDYVLGHDEVSPNRKVDPGGALSKTMPELRDLLKRS